ncbi:hypothetical protein TeGR_g2699 [Tetraparma gracilis]|uniref:Methyltransferase domain-containing protein n=1 Tax=Tetraparma gracilis TaxID=2962635 RepID=A0ABQ6N050_9STRA|nr:hypothetical protein TeGR_g2699 [Tetraparma gracilis]
MSALYIPLPNSPSPIYPSSSSSPLPPAALVYVFQSKGRGNKRKLYERARVVEDPAHATSNSNNNEDPPHKPDPDRRVEVRYSRGSRFSVRRRMLAPVLEPGMGEPGMGEWEPLFELPGGDTGFWVRPEEPPRRPPVLVLVSNETDLYRSLLCVHTTASDRFLEVGSDLGFCTAAVHRSLSSPQPGRAPESKLPAPLPLGRPAVLGVDISEESLAASRASFPHVPFANVNALAEDGLAALPALFEEHLGGAPTVVAVDINGTREVKAVRACVAAAVGGWGGRFPPPRLVVVKARSLHRELAGGDGRDTRKEARKRRSEGGGAEPEPGPAPEARAAGRKVAALTFALAAAAIAWRYWRRRTK